jgi:glutamine synthetase
VPNTVTSQFREKLLGALRVEMLDTVPATGCDNLELFGIDLQQPRHEGTCLLLEMTQNPHFVGKAFFSFGPAKRLMHPAVVTDANSRPESVLDLVHFVRRNMAQRKAEASLDSTDRADRWLCPVTFSRCARWRGAQACGTLEPSIPFCWRDGIVSALVSLTPKSGKTTERNQQFAEEAGGSRAKIDIQSKDNMAKYKLEYIWLDGYEPIPNIRGKTLIKDFDSFPTLEQVPNWGFDGSSTKQAEGHASDCVLKPVGVYPDATRPEGAIVMSEVLFPDGTPHPTNSRATIIDDPDAWFGFEQEYFLYKDGRPLGFPAEGFPPPQGRYYTGVGYSFVGELAREIVNKHLDLCLYAGVGHEGINAEVAKGQWEFQIFGKGSKRAADDVWVARYLMARLGETYGVDLELHCKPIRGDWNGSGMHCNFSTKYMREVGGKEYFDKLMTAFEKYRNEHIAVYGPDNHLRLTGLHETQSIDKFNYGVGNRGASVRIPHSFVNNGYRGYLEDRRPNSAGDPYKIASRILQTIATVPTS